MLIIAPIISVIYTLIQVRFVDVKTDVDVSYINKGEKLTLVVTITNNSYLPSPPIALTIADNFSVKCEEEKKHSISIMPKSETEIEITFQARIWGKAKIGIESVYIEDYFGVIKKEVNCAKTLTHIVRVIPEIEEIEQNATVINNAFAVSLYDDTDDTSESNSQSMIGLPGYDHREYIPGDPLKRVNWKLSAKKRALYVRLDDELPSPQISIVLDNAFYKNNVDIKRCEKVINAIDKSKDEVIQLVAQRAVEVSLGIANVFMIMNRKITFYIYDDEAWLGFPVESETDLTTISLALADFSFRDNAGDIERIPLDNIRENKGGASIVLCTPYADDILTDLVGTEESQGLKGEYYYTLFDASKDAIMR